MKKPTAPTLYPDISSEVEGQPPDSGEQFRLNQISEIRTFLDNEVQIRNKLRRKYKSVWNMFYGSTQISGLIAIGAGSSAVGTLASGIGAPISLPLSGIALFCGLLSNTSAAAAKATMKKVEKHEGIKRMAESSLNTINDLVSKALMDGRVSNEDFQHILKELENYREHKTGIKHRTRANLNELTPEREREIRAEAEEIGKKKALENLLNTAKSQQ